MLSNDLHYLGVTREKTNVVLVQTKNSCNYYMEFQHEYILLIFRRKNMCNYFYIIRDTIRKKNQYF